VKATAAAAAVVLCSHSDIGWNARAFFYGRGGETTIFVV
jgi:hypothetical protein